MELEMFCKLLKYKPKHISKGTKGDDVCFVSFRDFRHKTASIEFGCDASNEHNGGHYFYFEVLDLSGYNDMDFIPFGSSRRHDVVLSWPCTDDEYNALAEHVNKSLKRMYKRS